MKPRNSTLAMPGCMTNFPVATASVMARKSKVPASNALLAEVTT